MQNGDRIKTNRLKLGIFRKTAVFKHL